VVKQSKRYRGLKEATDIAKEYPVEEAVAVIQQGKPAKFVESVDMAIKLNIDTRQSDQVVRGSFSLPKGSGKDVRVIVFTPEGAVAEEAKAAGALEAGGEELAKKIADGWMDFDVAIAHPGTMRFVGKLGKILGPRGLMPTPKTGTVTPDVIEAMKEFKAGKIEFRADETGNVHAIMGRINFSKEDLVENISSFVAHIKGLRPASVKGTFIKKISISSTMGVGLKLAI